ncbi:hypothetical protein RV05_GL002549 [Enterococcus hirae]|nr:hypothetical protein RV05_GL002549 [Enterococcus hirae]
MEEETTVLNQKTNKMQKNSRCKKQRRKITKESFKETLQNT